MSENDFAGKTVIVTGAASGLARAAALAFAREGAALALADVADAGLQETADLAREAGATVHARRLDIADTAACRAFVAGTVAALGRLDALVNVAGVLRVLHAADVTPEIWDLVFAVNVRGPFFLIQAAMPHLIESEGAVLNIASSSAFFGHSYLAPYAASKAALVNLPNRWRWNIPIPTCTSTRSRPAAWRRRWPIPTRFPAGVDAGLLTRYGGLRGMSPPEDLVPADAIPRLLTRQGRPWRVLQRGQGDHRRLSRR